MAVTEARWEAMAVLWAQAGVVPSVGSALAVTGDHPSYTVTVGPGRAWSGLSYFSNDAFVPLVPEVADPANTRFDWVVVRWDWIANTAVLALHHGLPGVNPQLPALTQDLGTVYELPLARVRIAAGAVSVFPGDVTDARPLVCDGTVPPGTIVPFAGGTLPGGWLWCAGQTIARRAYARLFALLGTTFGAGDGSTTFALPDLRGRVVACLDTLDTFVANRHNAVTLGASGGSATRTLTSSTMPRHGHTLTLSGLLTGDADHDHTHAIPGQSVASTAPEDTHTHGASVSGMTGAGTPHQHRILPADTVAVAGTSVAVSLGGIASTAAESTHTHPLSLTGATTSYTPTGDGASHIHPWALGTRTTGEDSPAHAHPYSIGGTTGAVGNNIAADLTQPWLGLGWLMRY